MLDLPPHLFHRAMLEEYQLTQVLNSSKFGRTTYTTPLALPHREVRNVAFHQATGLLPPGDHIDVTTGQRVQIAAMDIDPLTACRFKYLGKGNGTLGEYISALRSATLDYGFLYYSFGRDGTYRRQSAHFDLELSEDLTIGATASRGQRANMTIRLGTFLAIEDACHAVFSDPLAPLSDLIGHIESNVFRLPDHNRFDSIRLTDYAPIVSCGSDCSSMFVYKFLSGSVERQSVADFVANLAIYWIIGHEDAHAYLGHLSYFDETMGAAGRDTRLFDELLSLAESPHDATLRRVAEFDADRCASTRLVDVFLDRGHFTDLPNVMKRKETLEMHLGMKASDDVSQTLVLLRMIHLAAIVAIVVLHRACTKADSNMTGYPSLLQRLLNVTLAIHHRSLQVAAQFPNRGLALPDMNGLTRLLLSVQHDAQRIVSLIYLSGEIFIDPDMLGKDSSEIELFTGQHSTFNDMFVACFCLDSQSFGEIGKKFYSTEERLQVNSFIDLYECAVNHASTTFLPHRMQENTHIPEKMLEEVDLLAMLNKNLRKWKNGLQ